MLCFFGGAVSAGGINFRLILIVVPFKKATDMILRRSLERTECWGQLCTSLQGAFGNRTCNQTTAHRKAMLLLATFARPPTCHQGKLLCAWICRIREVKASTEP